MKNNEKQPYKFMVTDDILETIEELAKNHLTQQQMYHFFGISDVTWMKTKKRFPKVQEIIDKGRATTQNFVVGKLMEQINKGNISAIIFYLKTQGRWSESWDKGTSDGANAANTPKFILTVNDPIEAAKVYAQIMMEN